MANGGVAGGGAVGVKTASGALQLAVVPPFCPAQLQFQGPVPETDDGVPSAQRLFVGAVVVAVLCAVPQVPFTAIGVTPAASVVSVRATLCEEVFPAASKALTRKV